MEIISDFTKESSVGTPAAMALSWRKYSIDRNQLDFTDEFREAEAVGSMASLYTSRSCS
jgi:hypothetical protein